VSFKKAPGFSGSHQFGDRLPAFRYKIVRTEHAAAFFERETGGVELRLYPSTSFRTRIFDFSGHRILFSRRDLPAASAGTAMMVSAAKAASFGHPDEPPQGAINAKGAGNLTDLTE
jgi:hypothetical protein